jgi:CRISPR-associated endonuclease/helicase Cas3
MKFIHPVKFWGKSELDNTPRTHPLIYHSLDVAAVADVLLERCPRRLQWLAAMLATDTATVKAFLVRLVALHDIGKFHPEFQNKVSGYCKEHFPDLAKYARHGGRHDLLGFQIADELELFNAFAPHLERWSPTEFQTLFAAVAFHHGSPKETDSNSAWRKGVHPVAPAIRQYIEDVFQLIPCEGMLRRLQKSALEIVSWAVAGLTVLADWIGSNSEIFKFHKPTLTVAEYWGQIARKRAEKAVTKAGILPVAIRGLAAPADLLPFGKTASPLQIAAFDVPVRDGPQLFIIEDVTGAGKTEAALILASRLLAAGQADGLYFALPTMATANAMYERMRDVYRRLFASNELPSLVLAHGRRALNDGFTETILSAPPVTMIVGDGSEQSEVACAAWIADDGRKSFFAHVGAGTIDQALLGVLPSRHQALRLWGLADRVLIVDEAHSYDPYVNRELERLIEFHTALGGSTVVLSATLASRERSRLAEAYGKGAQHRTGISVAPACSQHYPLLTAISANDCHERPLESREELKRTFPVKRLADSDAAVEAVASAARAGASVAWIRNAVDDAVEAAQALEAKGLEPLLLHARFAMGDRLDKEQEIADRLGRDSKPDHRHRFVIVGTQILEQSLDYDVDAMVSDLAPIDLIIQRAGRLWRHPDRAERPLANAELLVVSPDPNDVRDERWYAQVSDRAPFVYRDHRVIWRTSRALFDAGRIETPGKVRDLIARVYDDGAEPCPEAIENASRDADGQRYSHVSVAENNLLQLTKGYYENNRLWQDDRRISTRLEEEPSVVFRLGLVSDGKIVPWCSEKIDMNDARQKRQAWALSEVSIQTRRASGVPLPAGDLARMVQAAKSDWGRWEQDTPLLLLEPDGSSWRGRVTAGGGERVALYDKRLGLRIAER